MNNSIPDTNEINFLGLKFSLYSRDEFTELTKYIIKSKLKKIIYGYSLILIKKFKENPEIYQISKNFDYFLIDGRGIYFLLKLFGKAPKDHFSIPDYAEMLIKIANESKFKLFLLGSHNELNKKAQENVKKKFPNIENIDGHHGYFSEENEEQIVKYINDIKPHIILIGISSPKKENFVYKWKNKLDANIIVNCGGFIDILAGKTKREPLIIKNLGLTWFYRFLQEPKRLFKPMLLGFISVVFTLIPTIIIKKYIFNKSFSIPEYYGIKETD